MDKIKKFKNTSLTSLIETENVEEMANRAGNLYEAVAIIARRSNQISLELKSELHSKLEDFATSIDNLEEVHENREQIEISKAYERLPHPTLIAAHEFANGNLSVTYREAE